jgi:hypothetical protein
MAMTMYVISSDACVIASLAHLADHLTVSHKTPLLFAVSPVHAHPWPTSKSFLPLAMYVQTNGVVLNGRRKS